MRRTLIPAGVTNHVADCFFKCKNAGRSLVGLFDRLVSEPLKSSESFLQSMEGLEMRFWGHVAAYEVLEAFCLRHCGEHLRGNR